MNAALLYRFVWKEGRLLWPLNLALLVVGTFFFRMLAMFGGLEQQAFDLQQWGLAWASSLVLLALVNGALTFAPENDQQTLRFLRTLPLPPGQLALAKLAGTALPVFIAFVGSLLGGGSILQLGLGRLFRDSYPGQLVDDSIFFVPHLLLLGLAAFALGACCSLLLRQSVLALCAGLLGLLALNSLLGSTWSQNSSPAFFWGRLAGLLLLSLGSLAAIVSWLSPAWVRDQSLRISPFTAAKPLMAIDRWQPSAFGRQFGRLLWQTLRLNAGILLAGLALPAVLVLAALVAGNLVGPFIAWLPPALFAALASTAFWNDQRLGRYRFFHQHPASARTLWVARVLPWLTVAMVVGVAFQVTIQTIFASDLLQRTDPTYWSFRITEYNNRDWLHGLFLQSPSAGLLMFGLAAAMGAFCSLAFRSGIVACFAAVVGQAGMVLVANYLTWLGGNLIWCLAPVAFGLLWAGWWSAPRWLNQRVTWTSRLGVATGLVVASCCSIGLLATWRAQEIDSLIVPTELMISRSISGLPSPNQPATRENFTAPRVTESIRYRAEQIETARELVTFLAPLREQSQKWNAWQLWDSFFGVDFNPLSVENSGDKLQRFIVSDLHERIARGELEAARENLRLLLWIDSLYAPFPESNNGFVELSEAINAWSVAPGQTPQLLQSFLSELQNGDLLRPTLLLVYAERIAAELRRPWSFPTPAESEVVNLRPGAVGRYQLGLALPWERIRCAALIERQAEFLRNDFGRLYREFANNPIPENFYIYHHDRFLEQSNKLGNTSPVAFNLAGEISELFSDLQIRNWLMLRLALLAYHLEHGGYPESLQPLSVYFGSNQPRLLQSLSKVVVYLPRGSEFHLVWNDRQNEEQPVFVPHTPVLLPIRSLESRPTGQVTVTHSSNEPAAPLVMGIYTRSRSSWDDFESNDDTLITDRFAAIDIQSFNHGGPNHQRSQIFRQSTAHFNHVSRELIELAWLPTEGQPAPSKPDDQ